MGTLTAAKGQQLQQRMMPVHRPLPPQSNTVIGIGAVDPLGLVSPKPTLQAIATP
jgi:hypothetical protein